MANTSYDLSNPKRDVQEAFDMLVVSRPNFLSLIPRGANATQTKVEWYEDSMTPLSTTIGSFDSNNGSGTGINVASTTGMVAGQLLRFESSTGADHGEIVRIVSVDSSTDLTVTRGVGGTDTTALTCSHTVFRVSTPKNEGTSASAGATREGTLNYNYTQIFDRTAKLSKTALQADRLGATNQMSYQIAKELIEINYELNAALIYGEREERTSSIEGAMGGIMSFLRGGNVETTGSAISKTIINNMFKLIFDDGAGLGNYAILCNANQAQKISAFNTSGTNPIVSIPQGSTVTGGSISTFISDLPSMNGFTARVVVDPMFPKDKVALIDLNHLEFAYLRPFTTTIAHLPSDDFEAQRILGELTLRMRNGTKAHALATGLTV